MDPADIAALFYGDEATGPEKAQQLAAALRGDTQLGQLGMLTGDKVLGGVGQSLVQGAQQGQQQLEKAANMRLTRAMQAEQQKTEQAFRQAQEAHMQKQEAFEGQRLAQDNAPKFIQGNGSAPPVIFDPRKKTATIVPGYDPGAGGGGPQLSPKQLNDEFIKFGQSIDPNRKRSSIAADLQGKLNMAEGVEALIGQNLETATPEQKHEAYMALARIVSGTGGSTAASQIEAVTPPTMAEKWARAKQFLLNRPESAEAKDFLVNMMDTLGREKATARKQIRSAQFAEIPTFSNLRGSDRKRFEAILKGVGIDPADVDETGLEIVKQAAAAGGGAPGGGGLSPEKLKRLEELRALQAAGKLK